VWSVARCTERDVACVLCVLPLQTIGEARPVRNAAAIAAAAITAIAVTGSAQQYITLGNSSTAPTAASSSSSNTTKPAAVKREAATDAATVDNEQESSSNSGAGDSGSDADAESDSDVTSVSTGISAVSVVDMSAQLPGVVLCEWLLSTSTEASAATAADNSVSGAATTLSDMLRG
jgi:hypothetical protein